MSLERYFDNAATTQVDPRALAEMLPYFNDSFGNANSIHEPGKRAREAVEVARSRVASLLGADDPSQVIFTSGASEANNWIISVSGRAACSPFEHNSVRQTIDFFQGQTLGNEGYVLKKLEEPVDCLAIMHVNNETGAILEVPQAIASQSKTGGCAPVLLRDVTQSVGKVDLPRHEGEFFASLSAHKFYGPKGVGALFFQGSPPNPWMHGGEHEWGLRAGTLNVPGIVGMGAAAAFAKDEGAKNRTLVEGLRALALDEILKISDVQLNSPPESSPYIVSLSFLGVEGESLVVEADRAGFAISSGAACSAHSTEPNHVLTRLGLAPEWVRGSIRISFGRYNTERSTMQLVKVLTESVEKLRRMK